ncbi:hypothetical protein CYMTET_48547 [Cymbomonas tetramitiformis]|uniref:Cadherin-like beta sandwich domain-containing protein n=1 Tax=Cymbomonas tetramitiformis TaxID=36881 RepID=A0AAE0BS71_9CHLO|nr:hypothetical protein CYMTET_48547 [Cymbomonas tetramitiformis]
MSVNLLQIDAEVSLGDGTSMQVDGFKQVPAMITPPFSPEVTEYTVDVPSATVRIRVNGMSYSHGCVKIQGVQGNMRTIDIPASGTQVSVAQHDPDDVLKKTYSFTVNKSVPELDERFVTVVNLPPPPAPPPAVAEGHHNHEHGADGKCILEHEHEHGAGGDCGHDHGHGHGHEAKKDCGHAHEHTKDCGHDHGHGHGHGHEEKKDCGHAHEHTKDCGHDHGHGHGHGHEEKKDCGHAHEHTKDCDHGHGHGHGHK